MNANPLDEKLFQVAMHRVRIGHDPLAYYKAAADFGRSVSFFIIVGLIVWWLINWRWALIPAALSATAFVYRAYMVLIANRMKIAQQVGLEAIEFRR